MNHKTAKKESELSLDGITVEFHRKDNVLKGITLTDGKGGRVDIRHGEYGGFDVLVPSPPPMVDRWQIKGNVRGVPFCETFEDEWKANERIAEISPDDTEVPCKAAKVSVPE